MLFLWFLFLTLGVITSGRSGSPDDLETRVAVLEVEVENIEDDINDIELDIQENSDDIDGVEDDLAVLDDKVEDLENSNVDILARLTALEETNNVLQATVQTLEDTMAVLEDENILLRQEVNALKSNDNATAERVEDLEKSVVDLDATVTTLEEQVRALELADNATNGEIQELQQAVVALQDTVIDLQTEEVSFLATFDVEELTPTDPLRFNHVVLNSGGHYDPIIGVFTVPLDGTYEFNVHLRCGDANSVIANLNVDGVRVAYTYKSDFDYDVPTAIMNVLLPMVAGQQVWVEPIGITSVWGARSNDGMLSWFSGHLIHAH